MRTGKLPPELLARLLSELDRGDPRVLAGPRPGEDAAAIALGTETLVVTTDPVTFVTEDAPWYAVHVNANDVAAMGAEPAWLAATVLLPPSATEQEVERLFAGLRAACREVDAELVTGHTEVTDAVTRPVIAGTMLGLARGSCITSAGARPGDVVLVLGAVGIEGTAALAAEARPELLAAGLSEAELAAALALLRDPGISVLPAARCLLEAVRPHALHDATEGGVATALREVAAASGAGMLLDADALTALPVTRRICTALRVDPLGLIASGCLIAAVAPEDAERALPALTDAGIVASRAGVMTSSSDVLLATADGARPLSRFDRDELARYLEERQSRAARG